MNRFIVGSRFSPSPIIKDANTLQLDFYFGFVVPLSKNLFLEPTIGLTNWNVSSEVEANLFETDGQGLSIKVPIHKEFPFKEHHAISLGLEPAYYHFFSWSNNQELADYFLTATLQIGYKYRFGK